MNKKYLFITTAIAALAACSQIPKEAYYSRGQPESLLDATSERVDLKVDSPANIEQATGWINRDQPTRAELRCPETDGVCGEMQSVLHQFGVPVKYVASGTKSLVLIYDRVQARDCESRYIDNIINPYNLNHPTFGCTIAVNIAQMVSDKREFTAPPLMGEDDAYKTSQAYGFYAQPSLYSPPRSSSDFSAIATEQSIQTTGLVGGSGGSR